MQKRIAKISLLAILLTLSLTVPIVAIQGAKPKYWELNPMVIGDWLIGNYNWEEAATQPWCKGSGTLEDPYMITNVVIDGTGSGFCMMIRDSDVHFKVMNCIFKNAKSGLILFNLSNGLIFKNKFLDNRVELPEPGGFGILLAKSDNNEIKKNTARGNQKSGIHLANSDNNLIVDNNCEENMRGIMLADAGTGGSDENTIIRNNCKGNYQGIMVWMNSNNNLITKNDCTENVGGIEIHLSYGNILSGNTIENNVWGVGTGVGSYSNIIYHNNFINNSQQAWDAQLGDNNWYHPDLLEGNYWSDYSGVDDGSGCDKHAIAGDGIGDTDLPWYLDPYPFINENGWESD